jgi:hypothetical protein
MIDFPDTPLLDTIIHDRYTCYVVERIAILLGDGMK